MQAAKIINFVVSSLPDGKKASNIVISKIMNVELGITQGPLPIARPDQLRDVEIATDSNQHEYIRHVIASGVNHEIMMNGVARFVSKRFGQKDLRAGFRKAQETFYVLEKLHGLKYPQVQRDTVNDFIDEWTWFLMRYDDVKERHAHALAYISQNMPIPSIDLHTSENPYLMEYFGKANSENFIRGELLAYELKRRQAIEDTQAASPLTS